SPTHGSVRSPREQAAARPRTWCARGDCPSGAAWSGATRERGQRGADAGVTALLGGPPQVIAKPKLSQPGTRVFIGPSPVTTPTGDVHPARPIRPVEVSFVKGAMKAGS